MAAGVSTFLGSEVFGSETVPVSKSVWQNILSGKRYSCYFCFTAIAEISMRALLTKAAAWMVARAGLGSGKTPL